MPRSRIRQWLFWFLKVILSVALLAWLFRMVDFRQFFSSIRHANVWLLALATAAFIPSQIYDTYRWLYVARQLDASVTFRALFRPNISGQFFGRFLPGDVSADFVRVIAAARRHSGTLAIVLSVTIEKFSMLFVVPAIAFVGMMFAHPALRIPVIFAILGAFLVAGAAIFLFLALYRGKKLIGWMHRIPWMPARIRRLLDNLSELPRLSLSSCLGIVLFGLGQQLSQGVTSYFIVRGMHLEVPLIDWIAIYSIVTIVRNVPITISGLGLREGLYALFLGLYGVSVAQSTANSLVAFFISTVMVTVAWVLTESVAHILHASEGVTSGRSVSRAGRAKRETASR